MSGQDEDPERCQDHTTKTASTPGSGKLVDYIVEFLASGKICPDMIAAARDLRASWSRQKTEPRGAADTKKETS
jgi:hypothetical protein